MRSRTFYLLSHTKEKDMKTIALFCLFFATTILGCAHQSTPDTSEPEPIFEEEKSDEGYAMLSDEDVGISKEDNAKADTSTASNP